MGCGAQPPRTRRERSHRRPPRAGPQAADQGREDDNSHEAEAFATKAAELIALHRIAAGPAATDAGPAPRAAPGAPRAGRVRPGPAGPARRRRPGSRRPGRVPIRPRRHDRHPRRVPGRPRHRRRPVPLVARPGRVADGQDPSPHARRHPALAPGVPVRVRRPCGRAAGRRPPRRRARAAAGGTTLPDLPARRRRGRPVRGRVVRSRGRGLGSAPAAAAGWQDGHRAAGAADIGRTRLSSRPAIGPGRR